MMTCAALPDLDWTAEAAHWPLHKHSRFVRAGGLDWHTQRLGDGPVCLLIHGAGSSLHSWHRLMPLLVGRWSVLAVDLPGHGFTRGEPDSGMSLGGMTTALATLLRTMRLEPQVIVGHSAGAAVAVSLVLDGFCTPHALFSLNGALVPFDPRYELLFAPLARIFSVLPLAPGLLAWHARERTAVERLIASTGSRLEPADVDLYWRLMRSPRHVAGVLRMMSRWSVRELDRRLPRLAVPLVQVVGACDRTVPPDVARQVREQLPAATIVTLPGLGHLAHEERPEQVAEVLYRECDRIGL